MKKQNGIVALWFDDSKPDAAILFLSNLYSRPPEYMNLLMAMIALAVLKSLSRQ